MDLKTFEKNLRRLIIDCAEALSKEGLTSSPFERNADFEIELDIPKDTRHGDISTNVALKLSKSLKQPPIEYATILAKRINQKIPHTCLKSELDRAEAKHPGFINFWVSEERLFRTLGDIAKKKGKYGMVAVGKNKKVNIEFVSANPTGPLTIAHGRQAAFGDSLANILEFAQYKVTREYYLNDSGNQMTLLARSIRARYLELCDRSSSFPTDGYRGAYIMDIAADIKSKYGFRFVKKESLRFFADFGTRWIIARIKRDLASFNVKFDVWYSEKKLHDSGKIKKVLSFLSEKKKLYEKGGATWFKSTEFGDDKDRVVVKNTGEYTYLAPDIAYHMDKYKRGFSQLIDIWGPDHHGYVSRIKAAMQACGYKRQSLRVLLVQLSTLYKEGKVVRMSTRAGEFITLRDLINEVGADVARFFFLRRKRDSHLDFDLELAKRHSMDNPVYYIQYAHARICSILKFKRERKKRGIAVAPHRRHLNGEDDLDIIKLLGRFPLIVQLCARKLEVFPLIAYLEDVAAAFHSYYDKYRIVTDDLNLAGARLFLCLAIRTVIANGLKLLGVASPKSM